MPNKTLIRPNKAVATHTALQMRLTLIARMQCQFVWHEAVNKKFAATPDGMAFKSLELHQNIYILSVKESY